MTFTAAQIAQALGCTPQAIRQRLAAVPSTGRVIIQGATASGWDYSQMPDCLRARCPLASCYASGKMHPDALALADKRRTALLPFLQIKDTDPRRPGEIEADGVSAYTRVFGHAITPQGWRKLFDRAIARDRNHGDWMRLEIYLDAAPGQSSPRSPSRRPAFDHTDLGEAIAALKDAAAPSPQTRLYVFDTAFRHLDELLAENQTGRDAVKQSLLTFLWSAMPALAESPKALKRSFNRKYARWIKSGRKPSGIQDQRAAKSGWHRAPKISQQAQDVIIAHAVLRNGGRLAPTWRGYVRGQIPGVTPDPALAEYYTANPADKSNVPRHIAETVKYEVAAMESIHHGRYQYGQSAYLRLDDSGLFAGDWWSSDDCTLPVYFWIPSDTGPVLTRGQFLLTVDHRSRRILGFALIPRKSYDSFSIRTHFVNVSEEHGLCRRGVIWERGLWEKSKLVKSSADSDLVPPEEAELGLREFGVQFVHRQSPKAKFVERTLGLLQDRMEGEPGYCGRNEMVERFEDFNRLKADVAAGRLDPAGVFYSLEQWEERLTEICSDYNRAAYGQDTKLEGLSPDQAYQAMQNPNDPPVKFDGSSRHLLFTHRRAVKVTADGLIFECGKREFVYRNEKTGELIGRKVLIWFDPESPDVAYVTDLHRQNPFAVQRVNAVPTVGATREQLADEMGKLRSHQAPIRARYRALKANFQQTFRQNFVSPGIMDTGRAFAEGAEQIRSHRASQSKTIDRARHAGVALTHPPRNPALVSGGIDREMAIRARIAQEQIQDAP